jgi:hypothetical protein
VRPLYKKAIRPENISDILLLKYLRKHYISMKSKQLGMRLGRFGSEQYDFELKFCGLGSVLLVVLLGDSRLTGMSLSVPFRMKAERSVPNVIPIAPRGTAGQAASSDGPDSRARRAKGARCVQRTKHQLSSSISRDNPLMELRSTSSRLVLRICWDTSLPHGISVPLPREAKNPAHAEVATTQHRSPHIASIILEARTGTG